MAKYIEVALHSHIEATPLSQIVLSPEGIVGNLDEGSSLRQLAVQYLAIRDAAMSRLSTASGRLAVPPLVPTCAALQHSQSAAATAQWATVGATVGTTVGTTVSHSGQ